VNATTTQASGFTLLIALASILGMAYLEVRRKKR
jgi:adenine/guanine phosphoribosyltransferase-like PRPP-binding protein